MWRGRVHGLWFAAAVAIAVIGVVALGSGSGGASPNGAGSWIIAIATFAGVAYCLFRASRRNPGPPSER
jgi:drug/metabolite transporter (DMT)-like permease